MHHWVSNRMSLPLNSNLQAMHSTTHLSLRPTYPWVRWWVLWALLLAQCGHLAWLLSLFWLEPRLFTWRCMQSWRCIITETTDCSLYAVFWQEWSQILASVQNVAVVVAIKWLKSQNVIRIYWAYPAVWALLCPPVQDVRHHSTEPPWTKPFQHQIFKSYTLCKKECINK